MAKFKTSLNSQWPSHWLKRQIDTNRGKDINNNLKNVPCQRRRHLCNHPNSSLPTIINNNGFLKLQCLLKKDNFAQKCTKHKKKKKLNFIGINYKNDNIYIFHYNNASNWKNTLSSLMYSTSLGPNQIQHMFCSILINLSHIFLARLYTFINLFP
jgi:hypothetical protein